MITASYFAPVYLLIEDGEEIHRSINRCEMEESRDCYHPHATVVKAKLQACVEFHNGAYGEAVKVNHAVTRRAR